MKTIRNYALIFIAGLVLAGCAGTPTQESTGEYLDDTTITTKVKGTLLNDPQVSGLAINVETFKGTVQLSGFANSEDARNPSKGIAVLLVMNLNRLPLPPLSPELRSWCAGLA